VADNLGDLGGTIYNVANNAIDDTGKYVVSALSANPYKDAEETAYYHFLFRSVE
jgi:hypothetical protein